jgi:predicted nucleotidyltransferase
MSTTAILGAIDDLYKLGLIYREQSGRQFLCTPNRDHLLLKTLETLFTAEAEWTRLFFSAIREALGISAAAHARQHNKRSDVLAAWIFGSIAADRDIPGSDVDLFALTKNDAVVQSVKCRISDELERLQREFGADVRPIVMSYPKAASQLAAGNRFISEVLRNARLITGEIPSKLRIGQANPNPKNR